MVLMARVFVLSLLVKIPYIGWIINLDSVLFTVGALILYLVDKKTKTDITAEEQLGHLNI